ncbi:hypothetical protein KR074_006673 [Drosophila pseudoananassae]|nr:hypothetical protein KR074_006673 [Drosophila pseudoananassae]
MHGPLSEGARRGQGGLGRVYRLANCQLCCCCHHRRRRRCRCDSFWPPNKATIAANAAITVATRSVVHRQFPEEVALEEEEEVVVVVEAVHRVPLVSLEEAEEVALEQLLGEKLELEVELEALAATERTAAATAIPKSPSRCTAVA